MSDSRGSSSGGRAGKQVAGLAARERVMASGKSKDVGGESVGGFREHQ
jgi:hypothetical protein